MTRYQSGTSYLRSHLTFILICFQTILFSSSVYSAIIRIPGDQPTIQAGIDVAQDGDELVLADGRFTGEGNRSIALRDKSVTIRSEHGASQCIIDCEQLGSGFVFDAYDCISVSIEGLTITQAVAERGAAFNFGFNAGAIDLTDVIITESTASQEGGGIYCDSFAEVFLTSCTISENTADTAGGGVYCASEAVISLTQCTVQHNHAEDGGGIRLAQSPDSKLQDCYIGFNSAANGGGVSCAIDASPEIISCVFEGNTAVMNGGGIYNDESQPVISNCLFSGNESTELGGGVFSYFSTSTIDSCVFTDNTARSGGGIFEYFDRYALITHCEFSGNEAMENGGGVSIQYGLDYVENCIFRMNRAKSGGALNIGGEAWLTGCEITNNSAAEHGGGLNGYEFNIHLDSCSIRENISHQGGGCFFQRGILSMKETEFLSNHAAADGGGSYLSFLKQDSILDHCTWIGNTAEGTSGAVHCDYSQKISFINCLISGNSASRFGFGTLEDSDAGEIFQCTITNNRSELNVENLYIESTPSVVIDNTIIWSNPPFFISSDIPTVRYSIVQDGEPGPGNINKDPGMIGGSPFDPRLRADSLCIDAGTDRYAIDRDLDDNPRLQGGAVDIGAFEYDGLPTSPHIYISMPDHYFAPGDSVFLAARIWNPSTETIRDACFFIVLMYEDAVYFMPSGGNLAHYTMDIPEGMSDLTIIPAFSWPEAGYSQEQALWYGAILDVGMTQMVSNVCVYDFDWRAGSEQPQM